MSTPKGYSSQEKEDRLSAQFSTVEPIREKQFGLSVLSHSFVYEVATDIVEALSTTSVINATGHVALRGDVISFTSGALQGKQAKVWSVSTNSIELAETLSSAPAAAVTFSILRHVYPLATSSGSLFTAPIFTGPLQFTKDTTTVTVTEDTAIPANNVPLPVKLTGITGDINITAQDLNVSLSHANDSVKIGDGTDFLAISGTGEANVIVTSALPVGTNNIGDVDVASLPGSLTGYAEDTAHSSGHVGLMSLAVRNDAGTALADDGDYIPFSTDANGALRVLTTEVATAADGAVGLPALTKVVSGYDGTNVQVLKTDANGELQVDVLSQPALAHTSDSVKVGDGVELLAISATGEANVIVTSALPVGTNNIGDVDVATQPARSHASDSIKVGDGTDFLAISGTGEANVIVTSALPVGTNNIGDVDVATQPARSHATDSIKVGDGTDFLAISGTGEANVVVTSALPVGTNNIGDVDIASQPARSHATDSIKVGDGTDFLAISATGEANVVVTSALPVGTNNIGDVDVLSLPGSLTGYAEDSAHSSGHIGLMPLAVRNDAGTALAADGDYIPLCTDSSGALRVASSAATVDVIDLLDTPLLDATTVNGSAGAFLQVVASTAAATKKIQIFDTSGSFIGVYTGAALSEALKFVFGPGTNETIDVSIPVGTRISLRSLETAAPTGGSITMNFIG